MFLKQIFPSNLNCVKIFSITKINQQKLSHLSFEYSRDNFENKTRYHLAYGYGVKFV